MRRRPLRVAFVGMRRPPSGLPPGYFPTFVQYHMELPWYYARYAECVVDMTTTEPVEYSQDFNFLGGGSLRAITEAQFLDPNFDPDSQPYDVVVHWRKWFPELYVKGARNVVLCQDHSFSPQWKYDVQGGVLNGWLDGILVFPTWHRENTARELDGIIPEDRLYEGMTLGVDTNIYRPSDGKDPYHLLWASDPGRGLSELIPVFLRLWNMDRRFRLTVTYPDYVRPESIVPYSSFLLSHPGVQHEPSIRNGGRLWDLFNSSGVFPYSSTFPEPSSRCHRQAMAAGSLVLYPRDMGTPSRLLEDGVTGHLGPIPLWPEVIVEMVRSGRWEEIGKNARALAVSESWAVQAGRFYGFFMGGLG